MGALISQIHSDDAVRNRIRLLVLPREHGAWGLLLIPFSVGTLVGMPMQREHGFSSTALLLTATIALFCAHTPLESYLGLSPMKARTPEEKRVALQALALLLALAAVSLALLFRMLGGTELLVIGMVAGTALALQGVLRQWGRPTRMLSQAVGSIALTSTAAAAYFVATGSLDRTALALWFVCWLFAGDQIHYVQVRLRSAKVGGAKPRVTRSYWFLTGQLVMLALVAAGGYFGQLPPLTAVALVPVVVRGIFWLKDDSEGLDVPWLGVTELLHGVTFGVLLTSVFYLHR